MTHAAGFEETILGHMEIDDPNHELPLATYLARYRPHRVFPPGKLAIYSNYGAALAGVIVAQVSGLPWEEYAEQRVLRPLGMQTATFREAMPRVLAEARGLPQPMSRDAAAMLTDGFRWQEARLEEAPPEFISHYAPAGALRASALDIATYMRALLDPQRFVASGVLNSQSVHEMLQPSFSNASGFGTIYHGFFQFPFPGSGLAFGHDGDTMYQHAIMIIVPDRGLGVFVAANTPSGLQLIEQLPNLIGTHLLGQITPPVADLGPRAVRPAATVQNVAGNYRWMRRAYFRTERGLLNLLTSSVETTANGDVLVSGLSGSGLTGDAVRYTPIGGGVYRELGGLDRIAFRQSGKDVILLDPTGANPLERIGFFAGTEWLLIIVICAHLAALWGSVRLVRAVRDKDPKVALIWGAAPALWLAAFIVTWLGLAPWLADVHTLLMHYPGALFPVGCWMLLLAAITTVLAIIPMGIARPRMPAWRWAGTSITWLIFTGCAVTLRYWGFLGFSAW
jgi:CubicO group peptidase (beta-lactamase class C family)